MKLLLTGAYSYSNEQIEKINSLGFEIDFIQYEKDSINSFDYDGVICNGLFLYNDIEKFKNLKFIQLTSAGYDRVPLDYISENKIKIFNAAGVYNIPIAEHTVLKILEFYKKSREFYEKQKEKKWEKERNIFELYGKNAAIIGCGNIGKEIARRLVGFGVKITGVDIKNPECGFISQYEHTDRLYKVLSKSDIVILALPLNKDTKGLFNYGCFCSMKENSFLINISRGKIVVQDDLQRALSERKIAGVALDVFEEEPLSADNELWGMRNVIITPHNSFVGEGNNERMFDVIYKNLSDWVEKK